MLKDKTTNIIINAVKPFKVVLEFMSCDVKDKQAYFKFKICNKINSAKMISFDDDIRMRLACREKVKIKIINENTIAIILPEEFAEEEQNIQEEIIEPNAGNSHLNEAIKAIKKDLKDGKTADMLTLMKALDSKYDKLDKQKKKIEEDERYVEVLEYLIGKEETSISDIQRHFGFGFARAASFIDDFESKGYISSCNGSKKRKVNITEEEFNAKYKK